MEHTPLGDIVSRESRFELCHLGKFVSVTLLAGMPSSRRTLPGAAGENHRFLPRVRLPEPFGAYLAARG